MTFRRVVSRNGLVDGDYDTPPRSWQTGVDVNPLSLDGDVSKIRLKRVLQYERAASLLAGDLRRLERDAIDEQSVCSQIQLRTGIDRDVIAAVLKEFMAL